MHLICCAATYRYSTVVCGNKRSWSKRVSQCGLRVSNLSRFPLCGSRFQRDIRGFATEAAKVPGQAGRFCPGVAAIQRGGLHSRVAGSEFKGWATSMVRTVTPRSGRPSGAGLPTSSMSSIVEADGGGICCYAGATRFRESVYDTGLLIVSPGLSKRRWRIAWSC